MADLDQKVEELEKCMMSLRVDNTDLKFRVTHLETATKNLDEEIINTRERVLVKLDALTNTVNELVLDKRINEANSKQNKMIGTSISMLTQLAVNMLTVMAILKGLSII